MVMTFVHTPLSHYNSITEPHARFFFIPLRRPLYRLPIDAWPRSKQRRKNRHRATVVVGPRSTTLLATSLERAGPRWRALLDVCNGVGVPVELRVLSLSVEEGRSTFGVTARIWVEF